MRKCARIVNRVGGDFLFGVGLAVLLCQTASAAPRPWPRMLGVVTESRAEQYRRVGDQALLRKEWHKARRAFEKSLEMNPNLAGALIGLGRAARGEGKHAEAQSYFHEALSAHPEDPEVALAWGRYLFLERRFDEAERVLRTAALDRGAALKAYLNLAEVYLFGKKDPSKAIESFRAAIDIEANHAGAHYGLGKALAQIDKFDEAETALKRAANLAPTNPLPYGTLGNLYTLRSQMDKALWAFSRAIGAQPDYVPAYFMRGEIYFNQEKYDQALREYSAIIRIEPTNASAHLRRGFVYDRQKRTDDAIRAFQRTIELDPKQPIAYNNLAWISALRGVNLDQALIWSKKSLELDPDNPSFLDTLGWVHRARGELSQAQAALERAIAAAENPPAEILYHLGVVFQEQGREREARAYLEKALAADGPFEQREDANERLESLSEPPPATVKVAAENRG